MSLKPGEYQKSSLSAQGDCVGVTLMDNAALVNDTKQGADPASMPLVFSTLRGDFQALTNEEGHEHTLARAAQAGEVVVRALYDGSTFAQVPTETGADWAISNQPGATKSYKKSEIVAFSAGAERGDFDMPDGFQEAYDSLQRYLSSQAPEGPLLAA